ncbi:MAG TPA: AMP-binding protein [Thermomicrobiales bacterium]|nr:AMP-binding protein [Thermomicrobiales bacterium]
MSDGEKTTFGRRVAGLAVEHPEKPALIFAASDGGERVVTWTEYERATNRLARLLAGRGVAVGTMVVVGLWNSIEHVLLTTAAWKLGALALPLRAALPAHERDQILGLAQPSLVCADWDDIAWPLLRPHDVALADAYGDAPLPDDPPHPGKAIASGGSTGRSKIITDPTWDPVEYAARGSKLGARHGSVQLLAAPLYHNSPFLSAFGGLADDHVLVIMERFDAARALDLIERHRVNYGYMPPIIMRRIYLQPDLHQRDLSSIEGIQSSAAPCPEWLKRAWIDLIGAEKVYEVYGSTEGIGATIIRGDEWLAHPGSVGRPASCEIRIQDAEGNTLPPGAVGEIFMRPSSGGVTYRYIGAEPKATADGFQTVGDLGWVDEDGYLFIADRRTDMIVSGGANVYPAEVEAVLGTHPGVDDVAVIGVPDEEWGKRVHAVVQPRDLAAPPTPEALDRHCRANLTSYKAPKTYEFLATLPRNEAGKIRRSDLAAERESGWTDGMLRPRRAAEVSER